MIITYLSLKKTMKTKLITCLFLIVSINTFGQTLNSSIKSKFKEAILYMRENSVDYTGNVLYNSAYSSIIHTLSKVSDSYYPEFKNLTNGEADKELQNIDKNPKLLKAYILTSFDSRNFKESALKNIFGLTDEEIQIVRKYIETNTVLSTTNNNIDSKPNYDFSSVDAEYKEYLKLLEEKRSKASKKVEILNRENGTLWLNEPYLKTSPENIKAVLAFCTLLGNTNNKNNSISLIKYLGLESKCSSKHLSFLKKWLSADVEYEAMMENSEFNPCKENSVEIQKIVLYFYQKDDNLVVEASINQKSYNSTLKKYEVIDNDRTFVVTSKSIFQGDN